MRACLFLISGTIVLACSREHSGSTQNGQLAGQSQLTNLGNARCEMVEREGGPCVLWGPSMIELIARPELYDGKRVRVIGFVNFEFEGNGLYVSADDWRQNIYRNGVWINPPGGFGSDSGPPQRRPNQRYVIVEATFRGGRGGHFGMWSGTLEQVTRLDPWGRDSTSAGTGARVR
jgi:hypothetical protein